MKGTTVSGPLAPADRLLLLDLQRRALRYFLDNQLPSGLILDRQANHGPRRERELVSTAATGMGFIALALAAAPPYRLLPRSEAAARVRTGIETALRRLRHHRGIMPHFLDPHSGAALGSDRLSTIDSAWLIAGALWAATLLPDRQLGRLAAELYHRVDWLAWTVPDGPGWVGLLRHGQDQGRRFLACCWDRLNGETAFMYVLAAGAAEERAVPATAWQALQTFSGTIAGLCFNNADLGLFVFQYGLDLLDLRGRTSHHALDLHAEAAMATEANYRVCVALGDTHATYRRYWGLSAGDGPHGPPPNHAYRCYAPSGPIDGTAHLTAALASVSHLPQAVLGNVRTALGDRLRPLGRYGLSNINVDAGWVARDMVGIDVGAAVLALDNFLMHDRIRQVFHRLPCVQRGLHRLGLVSLPTATEQRAS
jgi:hypothetical protein